MSIYPASDVITLNQNGTHYTYTINKAGRLLSIFLIKSVNIWIVFIIVKLIKYTFLLMIPNLSILIDNLVVL